MESRNNNTSGNRLGITYMVVAMLLFTINDTIGKWLVTDYPVGQLLALRSAAALVVLGILVWRQRASLHFGKPDKPVIHAMRLVFAVLEPVCFYWSVRYLPLADVFMFYMASPLFLTIFSVVIMKEHVGPMRWAAVLIGLGGVFFIFPPSDAAFSPPALVALAGSITLALLLTFARMVRGTDGLTLITVQTLAVGIMSALTLPFGWVTPSLGDYGFFIFLGLFATAGHFLMNSSVSVAPSAVVAPFQYTAIIWAIIFGYIFWGDFPTSRALFGVALIIGGGLVVLYRENQLKKKLGSS